MQVYKAYKDDVQEVAVKIFKPEEGGAQAVESSKFQMEIAIMKGGPAAPTAASVPPPDGIALHCCRMSRPWRGCAAALLAPLQHHRCFGVHASVWSRRFSSRSCNSSDALGGPWACMHSPCPFQVLC